jgi:hypothetical protein
LYSFSLFNPNFKVAAFLYAKMILGPALLVASASIPTSGVTEGSNKIVTFSSLFFFYQLIQKGFF